MKKLCYIWSKAAFWAEFQHHHRLKGLQRPWQAQTRCYTEKGVCRPSLATSKPTNGCILHSGYNQMDPVVIYYWYQIKTHLIISKHYLQENISFPFWTCQPTFSYPSLGEAWNYKWNITGIQWRTLLHSISWLFVCSNSEIVMWAPFPLGRGSVSPCGCASCCLQPGLDWLSN